MGAAFARLQRILALLVLADAQFAAVALAKEHPARLGLPLVDARGARAPVADAARLRLRAFALRVQFAAARALVADRAPRDADGGADALLAVGLGAALLVLALQLAAVASAAPPTLRLLEAAQGGIN